MAIDWEYIVGILEKRNNERSTYVMKNGIFRILRVGNDLVLHTPSSYSATCLGYTTCWIG